MARFTLMLTLLAAAVHASPMPDVLERDYPTGNLPVAECKKINIIISILKAYKATPFCSSYLDIPAVTSTTTVKTTSVTTVKVTSTVTAPVKVTTTTSTVTVPGPTSTVFSPGNPPASKAQKRHYGKPQKPDYLDGYGDEIISSGCKCLDIPQKTVVVSKTTTKLSTATTTITTTTTPISTSTVTSTKTASPSTTTLYPCATPVLTNESTLPYGDASSPNDLGLQNTIFGLNDPKGASAEACCNTCYFGISNCVQAYFYFYEGCVVSQATAKGSGVGVSNSCPSGLFSGLTYARDTNPAFRSTGNFAGPCGVKYNNL